MNPIAQDQSTTGWLVWLDHLSDSSHTDYLLMRSVLEELQVAITYGDGYNYGYDERYGYGYGYGYGDGDGGNGGLGYGLGYGYDIGHGSNFGYNT